MNVVSLSLYGQANKYLIGAEEVIESARWFYPGWEVWLYLGDDVPRYAVSRYQRLAAEPMHALRLIRRTRVGQHDGMFWRFEPWLDENVNCWVSRDVDSRFSIREMAAVSQWLHGPQPMHVMRDNQAHGVPILGGMFGVKNPEYLKAIGEPPDIYGQLQAIEDGSISSGKGTDQTFLENAVWPKARQHCLIHDSHRHYGNGEPFPIKNFGTSPSFVGEIFGETASGITP